MTIYEQMKSAWESGERLALDRVAELHAAQGVSESVLYETLGKLLLEVRAAGADDDAEDPILNVMDRLTGWCHEASQVMTQRAVLPTEEETAKLPRWARVAFAARCARRLLPLVGHNMPASDSPYLAWNKFMTDCAERAATHAEPADLADATEVAVTSLIRNKDSYQRIGLQSLINSAHAAMVVAMAVDTATNPHSVTETQDTLVRAVKAGMTLGVDLTETLRRDFDQVAKLARWEKWTDETPVPPSVFGPLWPDGPPAGWPADPAPESMAPAEVETVPTA